MPGFDGTGPTGLGPMTGRGMGYCAVKFPQFGNLIHGYSGIQGVPVSVAYPAFMNPYYLPVRRFYRNARYGRRFGSRRGGRGCRFAGYYW